MDKRFKPVDLSDYYDHSAIISAQTAQQDDACRWDATADEAWQQMPSGSPKYQGIPFLLAPDTTRSCFIALGKHRSETRVPLEGQATFVCLLHFCDAVTADVVGPEIGTELAEYVLTYTDESQHVQTIRKRFEVDCFGQGRNVGNFVSLAHRNYSIPGPEDVQPYGRTETGTIYPADPQFLADIYALQNPTPDKPLTAITFKWKGPLSLGILGVTLYTGPGHPIRLERRNVFSVVLPDGQESELQDLKVDLDLGFITRIMMAPEHMDEWLQNPSAGLGSEGDPRRARHFFVEATTAQGAILQIQSGTNPPHEFAMADVYDKGSTSSRERACIEVLHPSKTWVHAQVIDDSTGKPTSTRIHFCGPKGEYLPPHGHHSDVNTNWFEDYAGEVKLGDTNYAYVPGRFQIELPVGEVYVELSKGFEYAPLRRKLSIQPGQRELELHIARKFDLGAKGWVTADTHVHFISPQTAWLEGQAEGVNLVNLLATQLGKMFTNVGDITGDSSGCSTEDTLVWVGTENRHHMLGHLSMLGAKGDPVFPMCGGGPSEAFFGDPEYCLLTEWAQRCREQQGVNIRPHFPGPVCEDPTYIVLGLLDGAEMRSCGDPTQGPQSSASLAEWYRYLNCGYRVAVAGGTDKMSAGTPVGGSRTYARLLPDRPFTFDSWAQAVKAGRTFVSNGPLIHLTVEGKEIGEELRLPAGGGTMQVEARATSIWPLHKLEIIVNGEVVDATVAKQHETEMAMRSSVALPRSSWIAARCTSMFRKHQIMMGSGYLGAHTSPVYAIVDNQELFNPTDAMYMLTLLEGSVAYLNTLGTRASEQRHQEMIEIIHKAEQHLHTRLQNNGTPMQSHNHPHPHG